MRIRKITQNTRDFNITDAVTDGGTDLNKNTFNGMQDNIEEAIPTKVSQLTNNSGYITRADTFLEVTSLDVFKEYCISDSVPNRTTMVFALSVNGAGNGAIVQKTTSSYLSFIIFGYGRQPEYHKYVNGTWSTDKLV